MTSSSSSETTQNEELPLLGKNDQVKRVDLDTASTYLAQASISSIHAIRPCPYNDQVVYNTSRHAIYTYDMCWPNIVLRKSTDRMLSAHHVSRVLNKLFPMLKQERRFKISLKDEFRNAVRALRYAESRLDSSMNEGCLRTLIFNTLISILKDHCHCQVVQVDSKSTGKAIFLQIRLPEESVAKLADDLEYPLFLSVDFCRKLLPDTPITLHDRPQIPFQHHLEKEMGHSNIWQRYDQFGNRVEHDYKGRSSIVRPCEKLCLFDLRLNQLVNVERVADYLSDGDVPFPLHNSIVQKKLRLECASLKYMCHVNVDIDAIFNYFGEEVAVYFAFLIHYTKWLVPISLVGLCLGTFQFFMDRDLSFERTDLTIARAAFAVLVALWTNLSVFRWFKKVKSLQKHWGTSGLGKYNCRLKAQNLEFQADGVVPDEIKPTRMITWVNPKKYILKRVFSSLLFLTCMLIVLLLTNPDAHDLFFMYYKMPLHAIAAFKDIPLLNKIDPSQTATSLVILLLHTGFEKLSEGLTKLENHKYLEKKNQSLIRKFSAFAGLDYLSPFLYLAFARRFLPKMAPRGYEPEPGFDEHDNTMNLNELHSQLRNLFLISILQNVIELGYPMCKRCFEDRLFLWKRGSNKKVCLLVSESHLDDYESTLADYVEVITQFALVATFSVAWTATPFFALVFNLIELRVDLIKLVSMCKRPRAIMSNSIKAWNEILSTLSCVSIVLSALMISFGLLVDSGIKRRLLFVLVFIISLFFVRAVYFDDRTDAKDLTDIQLSVKKQVLSKWHKKVIKKHAV